MLVIKYKNMINLLTKKRVLWVSAIGALCTVVLMYFFSNAYSNDCEYEFDFSCMGVMLALVFAPFVPVAVFSLITYRMKEEIFLSWRKFTVIYLFIYSFTIVINPWLHADFSPFDKKSAFITLVPLYFLISLILIAYKSFAIRKKG